MECNHDCLHCALPDCNETRKRKELTPEQKQRRKETREAWMRANPDKVKEYARRRDTKPEVKEYRRKYYQKYYREHKEEYRERAREYRKRQKEKAAL